MSLRQILDEIYQTKLPKAEQRFLAARAVGVAFHGSSRPTSSMSGSEWSPLVAYDSILASAGSLLLGSSGKASVQHLKYELRKQGGHQLASRLSRLSKLRNGTAHMDVQLQDDIVAFFNAALLAEPCAKVAIGTPSNAGEQQEEVADRAG